MALPFQSNSIAFRDDQRPYFEVNYWDTVYTTESEGIELSLFTLDDGTSFESTIWGQSASYATLEAELDDQAVMTSALGYTGANYNTGVCPNIYHYWGSGALPGITKGKRTLLKFKGEVKVAGTMTLVFGGQGRIIVWKNGVTKELEAELHEPIPQPTFETPRAADATFALFTQESGYAAYTDTFSVGDDVEIYYWHYGQDWGGVFAKVLPGDKIAAFDRTTIREDIRSAPVLGTSFMGIEAAGGTLASSTIPYVEEVSVDANRDSVTTATISVALTTSDQVNGFTWDEANKQLVDNNDPNIVVQQDRRVEIVAGYAAAGDTKNASGVITTAETYTRFTGHVRSISLADDFKSAELTCEGFGGKMLQAFDENYPDYITYQANAYLYREGGFEPMWAIPAFDNWPIELALAEYCRRAGIDDEYIGLYPNATDPNFSRREAYTQTGQEQRYLRKLFQARYLGDSTQRVKLERNSAYGNVGVLKKDFLPNDDEYLYVPEITRRVYDQATGIADQYGYNFLFDALGRAYLRAGNNPDEFWTAEAIRDGLGITSPQLLTGTTSPTGTTGTTGTWGSPVTNVSAVQSQYLYQDTADTFSIVLEGYFSKIDMYAGIGLEAGANNGGVLDVDIEVWNGASYDAPVTSSVSTYYAGPDSFYYDAPLRTDGTNATVLNVLDGPLERYRVTLIKSATNGGLDPSDGGSVGDYRINGFSFTYQSPSDTFFPVTFATDTNVLKMAPSSNHGDLRNHVIVVGSRKATITDSAKIQNVETNPSNPGYEFNVAVASDPASIYNRNSVNFTGQKRIAVVYDDKVSDSDFARWLALSTLFRYRNPEYTIPISTLAIPQLELGDALEIFEAAHQTVDQSVWVQSFKETWKSSEATVDVVTSSYPDIPSYQPKLSADIDALFGGEPIVGLQLDYTNILGVAINSTDMENPAMVDPTQTFTAMTSDVNDRQAIAATMMPESLYLQGAADIGAGIRQRVVKNHPYRHFWHFFDWNASHQPTMQWDLQEGDGNSTLYSFSYYGMPEGGAGGSVTWNARYKSFASRTGENPFYDPYSSELGYFISLKFDAVIEGRYRVSIWDATRNDGSETPVAWLTNPEGDGMEPEDHWTYYEPQNDLEFIWDGVDNIGIWNRKQSKEYAEKLEGSFGDEPLAVGSGFYAWNDQSKDITTQIGDNVAANYRGTSGYGVDIRNQEMPYYTMGKYSKFYIKVEVLNDELIYRDWTNVTDPKPLGTPRSVRTDKINDVAQLVPTNHPRPVGDGGNLSELYIWTHMGEPSQVNISALDWDTTPSDWATGVTPDWFALTSSDPAQIRDGKPVKFTFEPLPRQGTLFGDDNIKTNVQLVRQVHLQATIFDQFWTFSTQQWEGVDYRNSYQQRKRLTNRMFHNNDKAKEWRDSTFQSGSNVSGLEWVFQPKDFELDFGNGIEESIRFGDYEQLEALPGFNPQRSGGAFDGDTAYLNMALMNYLFYFSAYTIDRSGRRQWCLNREKFIDKSKIVSNAWRALATTFSTNPEYVVDYEHKSNDVYLKRSLFCREWYDPEWKTSSGSTRVPLSPANNSHATGGLATMTAWQEEWLQFPITYLDPYQITNLTNQPGGASFQDKWMVGLASGGTGSGSATRGIRYNNSVDNTGATFQSPANAKYCLPVAFGNWDFQRGPQTKLWHNPSPKGDFHPYWNAFMSNWHTPYTHYFVDGDEDSPDLGWTNNNAEDNLMKANAYMMPSSYFSEKTRDPKGQEVWFAFAVNNDYVEDVLGGPPVPNNDQRGPYLEQSVAGWADEDDRGILFAEIYDYAKQDELNRYEQFRGVLSRGPYTNRGHTLANWSEQNDTDKLRYGPQQVVTPAGVYYTNWARYSDFVVGAAHSKYSKEFEHWTRKIWDWFYIRFQHEYVWYNDRHFPVNGSGIAEYGYFQKEYTEAKIDFFPWYGVNAPLPVISTYYDAGAWTGWKDDIAINDASLEVLDWTDAPILRWGAAHHVDGRFIVDADPWAAFTINGSGSTTALSYASGGYNFNHASAVGVNSVAGANYQDNWQTSDVLYWKPRNIFDEGLGEYSPMRLAVGPELAVSREINMHLVLPNRLQG